MTLPCDTSGCGIEDINMLGRYHFNLPSELLDGGMRPLRDLNDSSETWVETICV